MGQAAHSTFCLKQVSESTVKREETFLPDPHQQQEGSAAMRAFKGFINRTKEKRIPFHGNLQGFEVCFCSFFGTETKCP